MAYKPNRYHGGRAVRTCYRLAILLTVFLALSGCTVLRVFAAASSSVGNKDLSDGGITGVKFRCPSCNGSGFSGIVTCGMCNGTGKH